MDQSGVAKEKGPQDAKEEGTHRRQGQCPKLRGMDSSTSSQEGKHSQRKETKGIDSTGIRYVPTSLIRKFIATKIHS
jgi:hypothetical protein